MMKGYELLNYKKKYFLPQLKLQNKGRQESLF